MIFFLDADLKSFLDIAAVISGKKKKKNDKFTASGRFTSVSTLDKIPVNLIASFSRSILLFSIPEYAICIQLLTVTVSIKLVTTLITEPTVKGIAVAIIILTIFLFSSFVVITTSSDSSLHSLIFFL